MKLSSTTENKQAITKLIEYAFNKQTPIIEDSLFLSRYQHSDVYGTYFKHQLTSMVMSNHFKAKFFGSTIKMAGIGYVASLPEYRGTGGIKDIMSELLTDLKQEGFIISQLAPFSENFYRKFGYENTSWQKRYQIPAAAFNHLEDEKTGSIVRDSWESLKPEILSLYQQALTFQEVGTVVREMWWWERLNQYYQGRFYAVCYDDSGQRAGYLIYRLQKETFIVDELVYQNNFALRKLLTYLKAHTASFSQFTYDTSTSEILENCFNEQQEIQIQIKPYMMSRIIDFSSLLKILPIEEKAIIFEVSSDDYCPENIGCFRKTGETVEKVTGESDIKASIEAWSELLLGRMTLQEGILLEKIEVSKEINIPKGQQSFYDYF
ncbi:GNAT family N-acetyltransferase [Enterococcus sp. ALS3]|uniref:GNAT family N-acetyltransferase n=1 Tax=Enterococcus alishanensis TaxID=1303817 RepID=A0ABS6TFD5_9ENTE|nr:GNAT family N-acetyltransferase [Enterococcus alishanensis]MBV7391602.1 GNAT family N-acetyltransferase [Enterococcus alishanensis]